MQPPPSRPLSQRAPALGGRAPSDKALNLGAQLLRRNSEAMAGYSEEWVDVQKNTFTRVCVDIGGLV